MNTLAASLLTLLLTIAGVIVLNTMVDSLGETATNNKLEISPVYIEEVRKGYLIARNLGKDPAEVDTLYIYTPHGNRLLASYKFPTPYRINPGQVVEIPIPASLWGTAPYAAQVRYVLGESQASISALRGPFLPQGGLVLGFFIPNTNTSIIPLLGGIGSVYIAGFYMNQTNNMSYIGLTYYDPDKKEFKSIAIPLYNIMLIQEALDISDVSHFLYSALKMPSGRIIISGPHVDPQNPLIYAIIDVKTMKATIHSIAQYTKIGGADVSLSPLPFMSITSLYYDEVTDRVYLAGFANITTNTGATIRATIVGYIEPLTGNVKIKALWNPQVGPLFAYNYTQIPIYAFLPQHTFPQIVVAGDRIFVRGVMDLGGEYADAILVLDIDLNQTSHLILFNNIIIAQGFSAMVAKGSKVYYTGLATTLPTAYLTLPYITFPSSNIAPVVVEIPPSPFIAVIDAHTLSVEKVLTYNGWSCKNFVCTPRALALGEDRLYLVIQDENINLFKPSSQQGIEVSEQYFYLAEIDLRHLSPLKMFNLTIYVNDTIILFNNYTGTFMGVHSASYENEHLILNILAFTAWQGASAPKYAGEIVMGFRPGLLEAESNKENIVLKDPVTSVNTTIRIYGIANMPVNNTIASRVLGNITIIDLQTLPVAIVETADFTAGIQKLDLPTLQTSMAIPLVFNFEEKGSPPEAKGIKIPLPNPPQPPIILPISQLPTIPSQPPDQITINYTFPTTQIGD